MTFSFHSLSSLTFHRCFPARCNGRVERSDRNRREYLDSFQGLMFDDFAEIERESFHSVTWIGASVSLAVAELYTGTWTGWNDEQTVPFGWGKNAEKQAKVSKKLDMVFRYFLESSKLLIVFLDRSGLVLCRNKVWAISIGRSSRTFKIKNRATQVHLTPENICFGILSVQLDRACQVPYTVRFSAL